MCSCTYNGWADAPEDEREAQDAYEAAAARTQSAVPYEPATTFPADPATGSPLSTVLRHAA